MYYVLKYYKPIAVLISTFFACCGLLAIYFKSRQGIRPLMTQHRELFRKWRLGPLILMVLVLNCFLIPGRERLYTSAEITLNYDLASKGLNPNGTRFNPTDILSDEVLNRAVQKGALENITARDLKEALQVWPAIQGDSSSKRSYFISTQFVIQYTATPKTAAYNGEKILTLVTQAYKEWFVKQYSVNTDALKLDFTQAESSDYLDACSILDKLAQSVGAYMDGMSGKEPAFRSALNEETFQSVSSQAYAVANTLVERMRAHILEKRVSKDSQAYVQRLEIENVFLGFDAEKAAASNENTLEAISMYADDMARIVLVPTYDVNEQFYMSQTRIGIDDFAASADRYASEKNSIYKTIEKKSHVIEKFSGGYASTGAVEKADVLIAQIEQELRRVARLANELVNEYSARQANEYMSAVVFTTESHAKALLAEIAAVTALFAVGLHLGWFALKSCRKEGEQD